MDIQAKIKEISMEGELWKPCPEFEECYLISSYGRVLGIGNYNTCKKGELLKQHKKKGRNGYMQIQLNKKGKIKTVETHVLVAKAFIPNPNNLPMINHKDENKTNNYVDNLEWCNNQYNIRYSHSKAIDVYTKNGDYIESFNSMVEASEKYSIPTSNISRCCLSKCGTTKGYQFRYKGYPFEAKPSLTERTIKRKEQGIKTKDYYYVAIDEYTIEGTFVKTWKNLTSAAKEYNIPTTNISKCCKGQIKTINGHIFLKKGSSIQERINELAKRKHKSKTEYV